MSEHTPGPWDVSKHGVPSGLYQAGIYAEGARNDLATVKSSEADARIIAAAPDLLAALEALMPHLNSALDAHANWSVEIEQARAALVKAKGG